MSHMLRCIGKPHMHCNVILHMTHKHVRSVMLSVQTCANVDLEVPPEVCSAM